MQPLDFPLTLQQQLQHAQSIDDIVAELPEPFKSTFQDLPIIQQLLSLTKACPEEFCKIGRLVCDGFDEDDLPEIFAETVLTLAVDCGTAQFSHITAGFACFLGELERPEQVLRALLNSCSGNTFTKELTTAQLYTLFRECWSKPVRMPEYQSLNMSTAPGQLSLTNEILCAFASFRLLSRNDAIWLLQQATSQNEQEILVALSVPELLQPTPMLVAPSRLSTQAKLELAHVMALARSDKTRALKIFP